MTWKGSSPRKTPRTARLRRPPVLESCCPMNPTEAISPQHPISPSARHERKCAAWPLPWGRAGVLTSKHLVGPEPSWARVPRGLGPGQLPPPSRGPRADQLTSARAWRGCGGPAQVTSLGRGPQVAGTLLKASTCELAGPSQSQSHLSAGDTMAVPNAVSEGRSPRGQEAPGRVPAGQGRSRPRGWAVGSASHLPEGSGPGPGEGLRVVGSPPHGQRCPCDQGHWAGPAGGAGPSHPQPLIPVRGPPAPHAPAAPPPSAPRLPSAPPVQGSCPLARASNTITMQLGWTAPRVREKAQ